MKPGILVSIRVRFLKQRKRRLEGLFAAWLLLVFLVTPVAADGFKEEIEMGKEGAAEVAKQYKFVTDPETTKPVETMGAAIAKIAREHEVPASYGSSKLAPFDYSFKIIDDKDVNAFSLPGGHIYVNKGLLDYVQSDDELAGVLAHEIVHASHHHIMQLVKEQNKQLLTMAIAVLAGAALGGQDVLQLAYGANLVTIAKMSAYGQKAERDADRTSIQYMISAKYNPVGILTFMERLARDERRRPQVDWGIFRTHPPSHARAREIAREIERRGIEVNRRLVTTYLEVTVKEEDVEDNSAAEVWVGETQIIRLADSGGDKAKTRAERVAKKLEDALLAGAHLRDVRIAGDGQYVTVRNDVIIAPTQEDADLADSTVPEVTAKAAKALRKTLWKELVDQSY